MQEKKLDLKDGLDTYWGMGIEVGIECFELCSLQGSCMPLDQAEKNYNLSDIYFARELTCLVESKFPTFLFLIFVRAR